MTAGDKATCWCVAMWPAGVCRQCGEKYFQPDVLKKMDQNFHDVFKRHHRPDQVLEVPAVNF